MTIYVFGDPELLREALFALASIFNLAEWSDSGNAMGLGGNMLAVALIGLVAVGIYGVTSQEVRVDYLLVALIIFGLLFSAKTDVNVEDIQTGDASVVADIPIGIAAVAAAASSAARSLTETTGTALQRVGSETSVLTQGGFLDPLRVLMSVREVNIFDINVHLHKSILEYYKNCVGRTRVASPGTFDQDAYLRDPDPAAFLFDTGNILDFTTIEYSATQPGGVAISCYVAAPNLLGRIDDLGNGTDPGLEAYLQRSLGAELYNTQFDYTDIPDAIDILLRGSLSSQEFMRSLFVKNMHNTAEAYAEAEYGTPKTQYVATVTDAFESDRVRSATEGTVFLQHMFPLMTFFQFLFFALAPFVALVLIANPFAATKTVGGYLLFGVWTYSWMPVAAVINHFIEITLQNSLEFSGVGGAGTGYTAILGFNDFYNLLGSKLSIGAKALQWTPIITAGVLGGSLFGISKLGGGGGGGGGGSTNTSTAAPNLVQNQPMLSVGGRASFAYGSALAPGAGGGNYTVAQEQAYSNLGLERNAAIQRSAAIGTQRSIENELESKVSATNSSISGLVTSLGENSATTRSAQATLSAGVGQAINDRHGADMWGQLTSDEKNILSAGAGLPAIVAKVGEESARSTVNGVAFRDLQSTVQQQSAEISAKVAESVSTSKGLSESQAASFASQATSLNQLSQELEAAEVASERAEQAYSSANSMRAFESEKIVGLGQQFVQRYGERALSVLQSSIAGASDSNYAAAAVAGGERLFNEKRPVGPDMMFGADGRGDANPDMNDKVSSTLSYLVNQAAADPKAVNVLKTALMEGIGFGPGGSEDADLLNLGARANADTIGAAQSAFSEAAEQGVVPGGRSGLNLKSASGIRGESARRNQATADEMTRISNADTPELTGKQQAAVGSFSGKAEAAATADSAMSNVSPELAAKADYQQRRIRSAMQGAATESTLSSKGLDLIAPKAGVNDRLMSEGMALTEMDGSTTDPVQRAAVDRRADNLVGALEGAVMAQFPNDATRLQSINDIYEGYQSFEDANGQPLLNKQQAALLTYGEVGKRLPGASDMMVAGLSAATGGLIGDKAGSAWATKEAARRGVTGKAADALSKTARGLGRASGTIGGVALFAGGVWSARQEGKSQAQQAARQLAGTLVNDFENSRPELAQKLDRLVAKADNYEDVFDAFKVVLEQAGAAPSSGAFEQAATSSGSGVNGRNDGGWIPLSEND